MNSAPAWEDCEWGVQFEPRCDVTTDTSVQLQERRSEDPSLRREGRLRIKSCLFLVAPPSWLKKTLGHPISWFTRLDT